MPRSLTNHIDSPGAVGIRLKRAREEMGLSQRQLAFPGCTAAYISRLEAGARVPSLQLLQELAVRLGVTRDWLSRGHEASSEGELSDRLQAAELHIRSLEKRLDAILKIATPS